ncbi:DUF4091 domain-containing protein [Fodinicola feengrottensis]|uniref:DUF4091 domain-containing protein n=1 Tax=Fodinicola feengrottensis TaxID=435914 RepID=UPI0013D19D43|nr:glycoside hydrolase domain-containing protein [Fodinicola feengrottensis]
MARRGILGWVASGAGLVLAAGVLAGGTAPAAADARASVWTESSYASVFKDSGPSADAGREIRLDTAKNDYEAGQVVLRMDRAFSIDGLSFSDLRAGGRTIAASNVSYNYVGYEYLNHSSVFGTQEVYPLTRSGPGDFPDRLLNDHRISVPANTTQSVWVRVYVPATAAAGIYRGRVTVRTNRGDYSVPISADVRNVTIPSSQQGDFTNVLWQLFTGNISYDEGAGDTVQLYYKFARYSDQWWHLIDNVAEVMKRYRTNELSVPVVRLLIDGGSKVDASGDYSFNWSRFDQVVERFMQHGGVKRLQGFWQSGRHGPNPPWYTEVIGKDPATGAAVRSFPETDSAVTDRWVAQYIPALKAHIQAKGWASIFQMQITDEPQSADDEAHWKAMNTKIRAQWPDVRIGDATFDEPVASHLAPLEDVMIPEELNYDNSPQVYDALRAKGKELWLYNCVIPVGDYLNRFIDQPEWDQRLTMDYAYSKGMTGYLHWAMNNWQYDIDSQSTKGDGFIVRPDVANDTVEVSPRYESLRDGIEDWEVLNILGKTQPGLAKDLAASLAQSSRQYTFDTGYMQRVRALILDAAGGKPLTGLVSAPGPQVDLHRQAQVDGVLLHWGSADGKTYRASRSRTTARNGPTRRR